MELPNIRDCSTVKSIANVFKESELLESVAYLELVINGKIKPSRELLNLGIKFYNYNIQELQAVQNRLALAVSYIRNEK